MDMESFASPLSDQDCEKLLKDINVILKNENKHKFPGYQPVSFMKCHIQNLIEHDYLVCEKTDGLRALLYICTINNRTFGFFLDRKNIFYRLDLTFPCMESTLFDGEAVIDKEGEDTTKRFLICDAMIFQNNNITDLNHIDRLSYALKFVRMYESVKNSCSLSIGVKEMQKAYGLYCVYVQRDKLKHDSDGLIFTPTNTSYRSGTASKLLKWKPPHLNSVDFVIKRSAEWEKLYELFCLGNEKKPVFFDHYFDIKLDMIEESAENKEEENIASHGDLDGKLGEFKFDKEKWVYDISDLSLVKGGWEFIKFRTDKDMPNAISVVINVMNSIKEDINIENLATHIPEIRRRWKIREIDKR